VRQGKGTVIGRTEGRGKWKGGENKENGRKGRKGSCVPPETEDWLRHCEPVLLCNKPLSFVSDVKCLAVFGRS